MREQTLKADSSNAFSEVQRVDLHAKARIAIMSCIHNYHQFCDHQTLWRTKLDDKQSVIPFAKLKKNVKERVSLQVMSKICIKTAVARKDLHSIAALIVLADFIAWSPANTH